MKNTILLVTTLLSATVLTACGGGGTTSVTQNNYPDPTITDNANPPIYSANPQTPSGKLIIDNGRGTMNNQDTEQLK